MNAPTLEGIPQHSFAERIRLAEDIWDSIATAPETLGLSENQKRELDNRLAAHYQKANESSSWVEVKARLKD